MFITLEGGEGAGKSLQAAALVRLLSAEGRPAISTREPGGTPLGERLRDVILDVSDSGVEIGPLAETMLFVAARAELTAQVIRPALASGGLVISDRYSDSTRAYQGGGRGVSMEFINALCAGATAGLEPDLVVLLDLPPEHGLARRPDNENVDRMTRAGLEFHERVRASYLRLAAAEPSRWLIVDATQPPEAITELIHERIKKELGSSA